MVCDLSACVCVWMYNERPTKRVKIAGNDMPTPRRRRTLLPSQFNRRPPGQMGHRRQGSSLTKMVMGDFVPQPVACVSTAHEEWPDCASCALVPLPPSASSSTGWPGRGPRRRCRACSAGPGGLAGCSRDGAPIDSVPFFLSSPTAIPSPNGSCA